MNVQVEKSDNVTTIILSRPDVRNAVDRATAEALAGAFLEFDSDSAASVFSLPRRPGDASRS